MSSQPGTEVRPAAAPPETKPSPKVRIASLDAFRGTVMVLMLAEVMRLPGLERAFPHSGFWSLVAFHSEHVQWQGGSLHDMIQPGFSFLVGAALPFSIASRQARGMSFPRMLAHAAWRALLLILLGIFLRSLDRPQTYFTFEDTLTQIGLGYLFLFLLGFVRVRWQVLALVAVLVGYWALFAFYPAPGPQFDYTRVGVPAHWSLQYTGFLSHWNKNSNAAWAFDTWFLNLFPREHPFLYNDGGYCTLSFIPTLGTMLLGLFAGEWLKTARAAAEKLRGLIAAGAALVFLGLLCQWTGVCPVVKRIWTPAFTLYSGGVVVLMLAAFYALMEWKGRKRWAFPLVVVGMNSIAIYVMNWTVVEPTVAALNRTFGRSAFDVLGPAFEAPLRGFCTLLILWSILFWMYRRKIFIKI